MEQAIKALEIKNLSYAYRSDWLRKAHQAIFDLSFDVREGESFGFLGHNGAGKTTTIKCILALVKPRSGEIRILGVEHRLTTSRKSTGYLPEQPYFYDHLTVWELVELYARLAGLGGPGLPAAIKEALEKSGISFRSKSPLRTLSKGLTQRVALAQAIVAKPRLLILDEPFSGLDPIARKEFRDLLTELKRTGTTIFMSSHILSDVESFCERAAILSQGRLQGVFDIRQIPALLDCRYELILKNGDFPETLRKYCSECAIETNFTRFVFPTKESARAALRAALESGAEIDSYQLAGGGLEELFLKTTQSLREGGVYEK